MANMSGGDKIKKVLFQLAANLNKAHAVDVGFLPNAVYPDGTNVAQVAAYNEFGTEKIPSRPFFRTTIAEKSPEWGPALGKLVVSNGYDASKALDALGQGVAGQIRQGIIDMNTPPNAPSTLRQKKGTKPLVDTGQMLRSVDSEVK